MKTSYWKVVQFLYIKDICAFWDQKSTKAQLKKNPEFMWPYFTDNNIAYNVKKDLFFL